MKSRISIVVAVSAAGLLGLQGNFFSSIPDQDVLHYREGQPEPEYMLDQFFHQTSPRKLFHAIWP